MFEMTLPEVIDKSPDVIKGDMILVSWNKRKFEMMVADICGETVILNINLLTLK